MDPNSKKLSDTSEFSNMDDTLNAPESYIDEPVDETSDGSSKLSRRDLLKKGWSVPVVVAMAMPSTAKAWGKHRSPGKKKASDGDEKKGKWDDKKDKHGDRGKRGGDHRGGGFDFGDFFGGLFG